MLSPDGSLSLEGGRRIAFSYTDVTDRSQDTNPRWIAMVDFHRNWPSESKYIFEGGYAMLDLENGKILSVKIP